MSDEKTEWQSIADLMAVLMVVFLFISVIYLMNTENLKQKLKEHEDAFKNRDKQLYQALQRKFESRLKGWEAEIDPQNNTFTFNSPFEPKRSEITDDFGKILNDFCPDYLNLLATDFRNHITEIRIEGHASSEWKGVGDDRRYLENMKLSQDRAYSVLDYCHKKIDPENKEWLQTTLRAIGMAFADPVKFGNNEDRKKTRRVDFRVTTEQAYIGDVYEKDSNNE